MNNLWDAVGAGLPNGTANFNGSCPTSGGFPIERLQTRLDALLMVLKSCKGEVCVKPWETLHPLGDVHTLKHAMNPEFDTFYASQPKISFSECGLGYFPRIEGPQRALPFIPREMT